MNQPTPYHLNFPIIMRRPQPLARISHLSHRDWDSFNPLKPASKLDPATGRIHPRHIQWLRQRMPVIPLPEPGDPHVEWLRASPDIGRFLLKLRLEIGFDPGQILPALSFDPNLLPLDTSTWPAIVGGWEGGHDPVPRVYLNRLWLMILYKRERVRRERIRARQERAAGLRPWEVRGDVDWRLNRYTATKPKYGPRPATFVVPPDLQALQHQLESHLGE